MGTPYPDLGLGWRGICRHGGFILAFPECMGWRCPPHDHPDADASGRRANDAGVANAFKNALCNANANFYPDGYSQPHTFTNPNN